MVAVKEESRDTENDFLQARVNQVKTFFLNSLSDSKIYIQMMTFNVVLAITVLTLTLTCVKKLENMFLAP